MAKFYASKIQSGVINPNTGKSWIFEDVPKLWRKQVEKLLS